MKLKSISALVVAVSLVPSLVFGQGLTAKLKAKMAAHKAGAMSTMKTGMMSHKMGGMHMGGSSMGMHVGNIIGNKNTKVYHLPGDKNLPEEKNRVYFTSAAAAEAAGYHASGSGAKGGSTTTKMSKMSKMPKVKGMKHMKMAKKAKSM